MPQRYQHQNRMPPFYRWWLFCIMLFGIFTQAMQAVIMTHREVDELPADDPNRLFPASSAESRLVVKELKLPSVVAVGEDFNELQASLDGDPDALFSANHAQRRLVNLVRELVSDKLPPILPEAYHADRSKVLSRSLAQEIIGNLTGRALEQYPSQASILLSALRASGVEAIHVFLLPGEAVCQGRNEIDFTAAPLSRIWVALNPVSLKIHLSAVNAWRAIWFDVLVALQDVRSARRLGYLYAGAQSFGVAPMDVPLTAVQYASHEKTFPLLPEDREVDTMRQMTIVLQYRIQQLARACRVQSPSLTPFYQAALFAVKQQRSRGELLDVHQLLTRTMTLSDLTFNFTSASLNIWPFSRSCWPIEPVLSWRCYKDGPFSVMVKLLQEETASDEALTQAAICDVLKSVLYISNRAAETDPSIRAAVWIRAVIFHVMTHYPTVVEPFFPELVRYYEEAGYLGSRVCVNTRRTPYTQFFQQRRHSPESSVDQRGSFQLPRSHRG